ncbi:CD209 antigen-like protein E [Octodon degus]|uniref:CD209 antigen-like protein E n=1 Tax=Octodon degus TaxID=10160 RepID=A0A6P6DLV1_OCTDE|nr:CD209 antigen-like protein E [Octodon degus]
MRDSTELAAQQRGTLGCLSHFQVLVVLQLLFLILFSMTLLAFLVQGPKALSFQEENMIYKKLTQLNSRAARLCNPCPWDWRFFSGNCYLFSMTKRNWHGSFDACEEMEASLVIITSAEEESFLQENLRGKKLAWIGLSDLGAEGTWKWVNDSLLPDSLKFWMSGEPNDYMNEDCAEVTPLGWNDHHCELEKSWICKKPAAACLP